jgi:oligopeptide/dipeptide ABC transporter ATP-binding protein
MTTKQDDIILEVKNLSTYIYNRTSVVKAVDGVSFQFRQGETLGIVGESGCGKTTTSKLIFAFGEAHRRPNPAGGAGHPELHWPGLARLPDPGAGSVPGPWSSLSPRMRVRDIVAEPLVVNRKVTPQERDERVAEVLNPVGLHPEQSNNYPHEFSGGQRQRIAVASALVSYPKLIVLDEPVSALDVSIRAQVMNLLKDLQEQYNVSYLLIAHNLATVRYMAHQTAVMYLGQIVEYAETEELYQNPLHPYTKALFSAALPSHPDLIQEDIVLTGEVPSPINPPKGCCFHPRCPFAMDRCSQEIPVEKEVSPGHRVSCHLY